jgi:energy-coupling factor transporter ATP-binding protein EcfA2
LYYNKNLLQALARTPAVSDHGGRPLRLTELDIDGWRNFRAIRLRIPEEASLVCLVGENGTGKSNILEFISAAAHHLGLAPGIESRRGNPFQEPHSARFVMRVSEVYRGPLNDEVLPEHVATALPQWDGTLILETGRDDAGQPIARSVGGVEDNVASEWLANRLISAHQQTREVNYLYLDSDRAYPPLPIQPHQLAEAWTQPWESPEWAKQWSYRPSRTLYEEWLKYFLALETRTATRHLTASREARRHGEAPPDFTDPFDGFTASVKEVLPHLTFAGVDTELRQILFDSAGTEIPFDSLSGGEREISFLIGQIERFQLRRGMFLLDEPELHLNPDLVRAWVAYLRDTVEDGQVWIATHSLEAVEVAGHDATFVLEREGDTRIVGRADPLSERPVVSVLSGTLGSPAFSLSRLRFVYVEGERQTRERERFHIVAGDPAINRFIEAGNAREVIRKTLVLRELADETREPLRIGGVIDRDFRSDAEVSTLETETGIHVLRVHEIENLLLQPDALRELLERSGRNSDDARDVVIAASDRFAGLWILQRAAKAAEVQDLQSAIRGAAGAMRWDAFAHDPEAAARALADHQEFEPEVDARFRDALANASSEYAGVRDDPDLWKRCLGKQVLGVVAGAIGLANQVTLERSVTRLWTSGVIPLSTEAGLLEQYVTSL